MALQPVTVAKNEAKQRQEEYQFAPFGFNCVNTQKTDIFHRKRAPDFQVAFSTSSHVYIVYSHSDWFCFSGAILRMVRLNKTTLNWERVKTTVPPIPVDENAALLFSRALFSCALLWDQNTVLFFCVNCVHVLDLATLTWSQLDVSPLMTVLAQKAFFEDEYEPNEDKNLEFACHVVDEANRCVYVQCRLIGETDKIVLTLHSMYIVRLDWDSKQWTLLNLNMARPNCHNQKGMFPGKYMALCNEQLYFFIEIKYGENEYSYNFVGRVDLETHQWYIEMYPRYCENGKWIFFDNRQEMKWQQIGQFVYGIGVTEANQQTQNDLWSLHLPTLTLKRHKENAILPKELECFLVCSSPGSEDIWAINQQWPNQGSEQGLYAYHLSFTMPSLWSLARRTYFNRPPIGLVLPNRMITRQKEKKKPIVTIKDVKKFFKDNWVQAAIFHLPEA